MTGATENLGIEWLVACLQPSDIAPHPNFTANEVSPVELFALLLRFQSNEYAAYLTADSDDEAESLSISGCDLEILEATELALDPQTADDGVSRLMPQVEDRNLALGKRAALSLIVTFADSVLDQPTAHVSILDQLIDQLRDSPIGTTNSRALAVASLAQHAALRFSESGQRAKERDYSRLAISALSDVNIDATWDEFPVSRGIGWDAAETQRRLVDLISGNAKSMLASSSEDPSDSSWIDVVRSAFPDAAVRPVRDSLSALRREMHDIFQGRFQSTRIVHTLGKADTALRLLRASVLSAELSGDLAGSSQMRETLGHVFSIRLAAGDESRTVCTEALRLLRQADAVDSLQRLLAYVRRQGPLDALKSSSEQLIDARLYENYVTTSDLALINAAADLLSPDYAERAISLAELFATLQLDGRVKISHTARWKRLETAINAVTAQASGNPDINMDYVAASALDIAALSGEEASDQFLFSAFADLASEIAWEQVSSELVARWRALAESSGQSNEVRNVDRLRIYSILKMPLPADALDSLSDLEYVAAILGDLTGVEPGEADLEKASSAIRKMLDEDRKEAASGRYTGRVWSTFTLAALLIRDFSRDEIWPSLLASLRDPRTPARGKIDALMGLTSDLQTGHVPHEISSSLASDPIRIPAGSPDSFFSVPSRELEVALRNFLLGYELVSVADTQADILADMGSPEVEVREGVADSCFFAAIREPNVDWPIILLLQLSHDRNARPRHNAGRNLSYLSVVGESRLLDTVRSRVELLLADPGIAIPLGVLRGLRSAARDGLFQQRGSLWCHAKIAMLAEHHMSRTVRQSARRALEEIS